MPERSSGDDGGALAAQTVPGLRHSMAKALTELGFRLFIAEVELARAKAIHDVRAISGVSS
jgi:hypothetical protein